MAQILVAIDCVGSTREKDEFGEAHANKRITAALAQVQQELCAADMFLRRNGSSQGDSLLLTGGSDAVGVYRAAVTHQSLFRVWDYNRIPIKIAIGFGDFEVIEGDGYRDIRGWDLDFLHRILEVCPGGCVVLTPPFASIIRDSNFGHRLIKISMKLKSYDGARTFYLSNGEFQVDDSELKKHARRRRSDSIFGLAVRPLVWHIVSWAVMLAFVIYKTTP
jgi:hypothetical protein